MKLAALVALFRSGEWRKPILSFSTWEVVTHILINTLTNLGYFAVNFKAYSHILVSLYLLLTDCIQNPFYTKYRLLIVYNIVSAHRKSQHKFYC